MEEKVVDRRVRKTKRQLRLALMKLMADKSIKDISVRELAAIADINRGTFYIHYKDVYDRCPASRMSWRTGWSPCAAGTTRKTPRARPTRT